MVTFRVIINVFWHKSIEILNYKQPVRRTEMNINVYNIYLYISVNIYTFSRWTNIMCNIIDILHIHQFNILINLFS